LRAFSWSVWGQVWGHIPAPGVAWAVPEFKRRLDILHPKYDGPETVRARLPRPGLTGGRHGRSSLASRAWLAGDAVEEARGAAVVDHAASPIGGRGAGERCRRQPASLGVHPVAHPWAERFLLLWPCGQAPKECACTSSLSAWRRLSGLVAIAGRARPVSR
jgi:hypothetical protein